MGRVLEGNFQYALHFVYLHQLFDPAWGYGMSLPGPNDGMSFSLGWSHVLVAVAACVWMARQPKDANRVPMRFFSAAGVALCALMLPDAVGIRDHAPLLPYVEFPWRLLGPATLCVAMLAAGLAPMLDSLRAWASGGATAAALALLIVPNLPHLRPPRIADVDLAFWTPHEFAARGFESTTLGEVTPRWMTAVPPYEPRAAAVVSGDAATQEIGRTPFSWSGRVQARTESRVRMSIAYYPGWSVRVEDVPRRRSRRPAAGWSSSPAVAAGDHAVEVSWGRSPARRLGEGISLLALARTALVPAFLRRHRVAATGRNGRSRYLPDRTR